MTHANKQPEIFKEIYSSAYWLSILFILLIFIIELGIMIMFRFLPPLKGITIAFIDSIFLVLFLLPAMCFLVFKPVAKNINKFRNSEKAFRKAKDLSERIIRKANVIVIGINEAGELNLFNETAEKISGYTLQELHGKNWFKKLVPTRKYPEMWREYISIAEIGQTPKTFENAILTKSGEERYISWQNELLHDGDRTTGIISYGIDITERKKAEDELKESEKKYTDLFEKSEDGNLIIIDGKIVECNNAILKMLRYTNKDRIINMHPSELSPEFQPDGNPSYDKANEIINKALGKGSHRFEWMHKKADGKVFPVEVLLTCVNREKKMVHTVWRDITARKLAETERQVLSEITHGVTSTENLDELLALIHQSLKKVLYAENCFFALYDPVTKLFSFPYFVDQFDQAPAPLALEKSCTAYVFRAGKSMIIDSNLFQQLAEQKKVELIGSNAPSWIGVPLKTSDRIIGVLVLQHYEREDAFNANHLRFLDSIGSQVANVIERRRAEEALKESESRLNELNATKDKFFSIIAHDLKSPFNSISGFSSHLVQQVREKDYEGIEKYAGIIETASQLAMNLLSNLMEWSLSQTGRIEFKPGNIEMNALIDEATEFVSDAALQKSIVISSELPDSASVFADKAMISTVFRNLISNAIKYTNPGGRIVVSMAQKNGEWLASVSDSGIGMTKEVTGKLFRIDESNSTPGTQNEKGTGLGLILCKEFVERHGGKIWAESEPGIGSVFHFTIPV